MSEILKNRMMTPGPTDVPGEVLLAEATPQIHHRTPQFQAVYEEVHRLVKNVFQTTRPVLSLCASGTGAMETAFTNLVSPGDRPIYVDGGKFGERWGDLAKNFGIDIVRIEVPWGEAVDPARIASALKENPACPVVFLQLSETSTGAIHPVKVIQEIVARTNAVLVVDAISGLGAEPCETDAWGLDVVLTGAQKSLMIPPGLAYITLNEKAWRRVEVAKLPRFYFDLRIGKKAYAKMDHPWTPPTSLLWGQLKALQILEREGIHTTIARHARLAAATRAAVEAQGLRLFAAKAPGNILTSVHTPEGIDGEKLVKKMRDEYGVTIAGAQEPYKGKFFRIGHLGYCDDNDVILTLGALERCLAEMGMAVDFGKGVAAAQKHFVAERKKKSLQ